MLCFAALHYTLIKYIAHQCTSKLERRFAVPKRDNCNYVNCKYLQILSRLQHAKSFEAILYHALRSGEKEWERSFFFYLFITESQLDYAICFVQSGNTSTTHGNALPFPRGFPRPGIKLPTRFRARNSTVNSLASWKMQTRESEKKEREREREEERAPSFEWYPWG